MQPLNEKLEIVPEDYYKPNGGIVFPNPNAPTGMAVPRSDIRRLLEADPNWPGFQRRLESAADAAEQWPTFAALPKGQWLPRGTHAAAHAS
mgnify:CR=1 FL=1